VSADTREMKCPGQHTFHTQCASGWVINEKHNICPFRRRDFSSCCITTSLIHHVEYNSAHTGFTVQWKNPRHQRLAALNSLFQLPEEVSLATSIASALLLSCYESADIAKAALCSGRLSSATEAMSGDTEKLLCFAKLVDALIAAIGNNTAKESIYAELLDILPAASNLQKLLAMPGQLEDDSLHDRGSQRCMETALCLTSFSHILCCRQFDF
jgi:hypothetical protein